MKYHRYLLCVIGVIVIGGCAPKQKLQQPALSLSSTLNSNVQSAADDVYQRENAPQVVRYDRYLLVSTDPSAAQRAPLEQIIDIRIPASLTPTVADAMRYALKQSGYSLCAVTSSNAVLYNQSLPAVHYQLGPMRLNTALQVMAGSAWQLEADDVQRIVCHSLRDGYQLPKAETSPSRFLTKLTLKGNAS